MNEQLIDELWQEAVDATWTDNSKAAHEKFAELIVRECARISNEEDYTCTGQGAASAEAFMQHFGVE